MTEWVGQPASYLLHISQINYLPSFFHLIVLVPVSCADSNKLDYLACLDSKTFLELGRVEFETKFLQALHGIFMWSLK